MARARRKGAKQSKQQEPREVAPEPVVMPADPYAEFAEREWNFAWLPDDEPEIVDEPALHALVKSWRHGRATRTIGDVLQDAYIAIFSVLMAPVGVKAAHALPVKSLKRVFAGLLYLLASYMLYKGITA